MITRRKFLSATAAATGGAALLRGIAPPRAQTISPTATPPPAEPGRDYTPVITPNNVSLPWKIVGGVKVYHLVAEEMKHEFAPDWRRSAGIQRPRARADYRSGRRRSRAHLCDE